MTMLRVDRERGSFQVARFPFYQKHVITYLNRQVFEDYTFKRRFSEVMVKSENQHLIWVFSNQFLGKLFEFLDVK